jgi:dTDP-4-dehydrorhamnose 3,5-epimerase
MRTKARDLHRMNLEITSIPGVYVAYTEVRGDTRGRFARFFCEDDLAPALQGSRIVQINHSYTKRTGTIRGLHFQRPPHAEIKFVRCIRGAAWDVAVDLRARSPTFLKWHAIELTSDGIMMLVIPKGCAHGFQALRDDTEILYLHTHPYVPHAEGGVAWNDPTIAIRWPIAPPSHDGLSERDRTLEPIPSSFAGIEV